jgi:hypothetical protein
MHSQFFSSRSIWIFFSLPSPFVSASVVLLRFGVCLHLTPFLPPLSLCLSFLLLLVSGLHFLSCFYYYYTERTKRSTGGGEEEERKKDKFDTIYTIINRRRSSPLPNNYWQRIFSFPFLFFAFSPVRLYLYLRLLLFTIIIIIDIVSLLRYTYRSHHRHRRYYSSALLRTVDRESGRPRASERESERARAHKKKKKKKKKENRFNISCRL